jgi:hypothetical protein
MKSAKTLTLNSEKFSSVDFPTTYKTKNSKSSSLSLEKLKIAPSLETSALGSRVVSASSPIKIWTPSNM